MKVRCQFPNGMIVRPDGVHELDPCIYEEVEVGPHCTVHVLRCKRCGHMEIEWDRETSSSTEEQPDEN